MITIHTPVSLSVPSLQAAIRGLPRGSSPQAVSSKCLQRTNCSVFSVHWSGRRHKRQKRVTNDLLFRHATLTTNTFCFTCNLDWWQSNATTRVREKTVNFRLFLSGLLVVCRCAFGRSSYYYIILCYVILYYTELFISPSGTSELDCVTTKTGTAERSISIGRESLEVFFFCTRGLGVLAGSTARG